MQYYPYETAEEAQEAPFHGKEQRNPSSLQTQGPQGPNLPRPLQDGHAHGIDGAHHHED